MKHYPFSKLGKADYGWLKANYHFSFNNYYDPNKVAIGPLCVWNDDEIQAGKGFPSHAHNNMEIITYVRQGAITHKDSMGNEGRTEAGSIQIMSAGSGVTHSEYNLEDEETRLFQIWLRPDTLNVEPRWEHHVLHYSTGSHTECLASGIDDDDVSIRLYQKARLWRIVTKKDEIVVLPDLSTSEAYAVVASGRLMAGDVLVSERDGLHIEKGDRLKIQAVDDLEWILVEIC